jgi:2-keto-4-pentenoate hydratase
MTIANAVRILCDHRLTRRRLAALPAGDRPTDAASAYAIQSQVHAVLSRSGRGAIVGHKIGCTTEVMQRFLGIASPCAGGVFASSVHRREARVSHADYLHVGVECEIVVCLADDLPAAAQPYDASRVSPAVEAIAVGMEIVDDRYLDYKALDTPTLIADDFFNAGCVIGEPIVSWRDLDISALTGRTLINNVEVGRGRGADVMGHPFQALAWLANHLNARGEYLKAGEFVFTGSVVETRWVNPGDRVAVTIDRLGEVRAHFA